MEGSWASPRQGGESMGWAPPAVLRRNAPSRKGRKHYLTADRPVIISLNLRSLESGLKRCVDSICLGNSPKIRVGAARLESRCQGSSTAF